MSPASYLAAPPRDAAPIVAEASGFGERSGGSSGAGCGLLATARTQRSDEQEAGGEHEHPGGRVEQKVVSGDHDREDDQRRVEQAREPREVGAREADHPDPD